MVQARRNLALNKKGYVISKNNSRTPLIRTYEKQETAMPEHGAIKTPQTLGLRRFANYNNADSTTMEENFTCGVAKL